MRNKSNFQLTSLLVVALALVASACTKSKELKNNVDPDAYVAKADLQGKLFHYSRGVEEADSDNDVGATPGMSDDFGIVKARITKDEVQFVQVYDPNGREATNAIVASYKITKQFDIKRDTNDYGNETNKVVEDTTNGWENRAYMRVDWQSPTNSFSKFSNSLQAGRPRNTADDNGQSGDGASKDNGLSEENASLLENVKFDKGHVSWLVETSVHNPWNAGKFVLPMLEQHPRAFRVVYRTHLMEVKASDFKPVPYTLKDFERFGYFFTQQDIENPNGILEKNISLYANVHNVCEPGQPGSCSTNKIVWNLSKNFPERYKGTARKVIQQWNETFQTALNRKDNVVVLDESKEADISDPTMNVLAFYPSRTKSGLLGVAQWVSDPRTGELVGVRATVYGDGIDYVVGTVDDKINLLVSEDPLKDVIGTTGFGNPQGYVSPFDDHTTARSFIENRKALGLNKRTRGAFANASPLMQVQSARSQMDSSPDVANSRAMNIAAKAKTHLILRDSKMIRDDQSVPNFPAQLSGFTIPNLAGMEQMLFPQAKIEADRAALLHDAEHGIHGTELVEDAAIRYLYKFLADGATKKDLDANRARIEDEIAQLTFYTTALHEMGHAFGLRHNFAGSADQAHFPQEFKDISAKLAKGDTTVTKEDLDPYAASSIMDYTRDFFSQKNGLGSYDKAAIKYAYNRSINRESDPVTLSHYMFCTDHQVGNNLLCQRFDKGHNVTEMVQGDIDLYDHNYALWHYRRGRVSENNMRAWGSPRGLVNSLLQRVFLPVRQSMDEFLYSFISAQPADGQGYCSMKFVKASIDAGEMKSICTAEEMDSAGVDPADMSTLSNALLNTDAKGNPSFIKDPTTYIPYGLADLVYANSLATTFFQRVLGAPEPGLYLAVPGTDGVTLKQIEPDGDVKAQAQAIAQELKMDLDKAQPWINASPNLTTEIRVGGYGRQLDSTTSTTAGFMRNESLGSIYDRQAALLALGIPGGAFSEKYVTDSMNGNAYIFPQTKPWTSQIMNKLITGNKSIASIPVTLKNGRTIFATPPSAMSLDVQSLATYFGIAYMTSNTDKSMLSKLEICDVNQAECSGSVTGGKTIEVHASQGNNIWRATQTAGNDSIAFDLLQASKTIDDSRAEWVSLRDNAGAAQAANLKALDSADALFNGVAEKVQADPTLAAAKPDKEHLYSDLIPAELKLLKDYTKQLNSISTTQSESVANEIYGVFMTLKGDVDQTLTAMGTAGVCWVQTQHPEALPKANSAPTKQQFDAIIAAKTNNQAAPANAAAKPANAPVATANACAGVNVAVGPEADAGARRLNLISLAADMKTIEEDFMKKIVIVNYKTVVAPSQVTATTNSLAAKEAQILQIRALVNAAKAE
jgi:hypothetical protein